MSQINEYIHMLQSNDAEVRKNAVILLVQSNSSDAVKYVAYHYRNDPDEFIRNLAFKGLIRLKKEIDSLFPDEILAPPESEPETIDRQKLIEFLDSEESDKRTKALDCIIKYADKTFLNEIESRLSLEKNVFILEKMISAVESLGSAESCQHLECLLSHPESKIILKAFETISHLAPLYVLNAFQTVIKKQNTHEKALPLFSQCCSNDLIGCFNELAGSNDPEMIKLNLEILEHHIFPKLKAAVIKLLDKKTNPLAEHSLEIIEKTLLSISKIVSDFKILHGKTDYDINYFRLMDAIGKDGEIPAPAAAQPQEPQAPQKTDFVLSRDKADEQINALREEIDKIEAMSESLSDNASEIIDRLNTEENEILISSLLIALSHSSDPRAEEVFINFLSYRGDLRVKANAVEACGIIGPQRSIPSIQAMLKNSNHRVAANACIALRKVCPEQVAPAVDRLVRSSNITVKKAGYRAAFRVNLPEIFGMLEKTLSEESDPEVCAFICDLADEAKENTDSNFSKKHQLFVKHHILPKAAR